MIEPREYSRIVRRAPHGTPTPSTCWDPHGLVGKSQLSPHGPAELESSGQGSPTIVPRLREPNPPVGSRRRTAMTRRSRAKNEKNRLGGLPRAAFEVGS